MTARRASGLLFASFLGSLVGLAALAFEWAVLGGRPRIDSAAGYALLGGMIGALGRLIGGPSASLSGAMGPIVTVAAFTSVHLLYFVNVKFLPGENYRSLKSVGIDLLVVALVLSLAIALARTPLAQTARVRFRTPATWGGALLLLGASVLLLGSAAGRAAAPQRQGTGPNLLLVVLDSARRDRMGWQGNPGGISPELDRFAAQGRVFENTYAGSSWTVPSVVRLLDWDPAAPQSALVARMVQRGYTTACFTDNPHMTSDAPLLRGFDLVERSVGRRRRIFRATVVGEVLERLDPGDDRRLVDRALAWAATAPQPFFLYVHLMDSHTPYRHAPVDGRPRGGRRIEYPVSGMSMTEEEVESVRARYDGGVRSATEQASRLLEAMSATTRPFVAAVTADHGESLGESGRWFHGGSLAPELLAVPLFVLGEGVVPGRVATPVGHDALRTTLLAAAGEGIANTEDLRAGNGSGLARGALPPTLTYRIADGYKAVHNSSDGSRVFFDLRADPAESSPLAAPSSGIVASDAGMVPTLPPSEVSERLRSLGYLR